MWQKMIVAVRQVGSYFHIFCPEGVTSKYRLIVYDSKKEPFIPLTEYDRDQIKRINESSILAYLNTLRRSSIGLKRKAAIRGAIVQWDGEPKGVKEAVRQYLIKEIHCKVRGRENHGGIHMTSKSSKTVKGQELVPITGMDKNIVRFSIRCISKH
ncbi:hypothetical protein [Paenibacillus sp. OK076]|uniref:hypothetical protein n=1 Tax=Paenibacillus sp. OK076 TaxID=1884379 RepID=UPI0008B5735B|nr:hypothetical protein [Paenibacillus sp. OK076]SEN72873.1 hypothetical protein SAMN05518670_2545 [Paenibacillus sp. OK076]